MNRTELTSKIESGEGGAHVICNKCGQPRFENGNQDECRACGSASRIVRPERERDEQTLDEALKHNEQIRKDVLSYEARIEILKGRLAPPCADCRKDGLSCEGCEEDCFSGFEWAGAQFEDGGDYTKERGELFEGYTVDSPADEIMKSRESGSQVVVEEPGTVIADKISARLDNQAPRLPCDNACKYWSRLLEHRDAACVLSDVYSVRKGEPCTLHTGIKDMNEGGRRYRKIKTRMTAELALGKIDAEKFERIERLAWNKHGRLAGLTAEEAEIMDGFGEGLHAAGGPGYL